MYNFTYMKEGKKQNPKQFNRYPEEGESIEERPARTHTRGESGSLREGPDIGLCGYEELYL